jgi:Na+-translocating ferredoxin:NAD+ oxidoreductase RnfD subunit
MMGLIFLLCKKARRWICLMATICAEFFAAQNSWGID